MIVISLALVIAAAVSLFIGLFVVTDTLTFIFIAIVLCLVSLLLLWLGTRSRKSAEPTRPTTPVYGGGARPAGSATPVRTGADEDLDQLTSPASSATIVRKTAARDRAATRVAAAGAPAGTTDTEDAARVDATDDVPAVEETVAVTTPAEGPGATVTAADEAVADDPPAAPAKKATRKKAATKKSTAKKATGKKATAKKAATKKSTARKSTAKKASGKKATAKKAAASGTTGAAARARLAGIAGVGPAKQDALLARYGSLEAIRDASVDDIVGNVRGFGTALATRVKDELAS